MINKLLIKKPFLISVVSIIIIFLSVNYINLKINLNIGVDLTESKTFSVSKGTKSVLKNIEEPMTVNFYYSRDVAKTIPMIQSYATQIEGLLKRYVNLSNKKINLNIINPKSFSDQEDQAESSAFLGKAFLGALGLMFVILLAQASKLKSNKIGVIYFEFLYNVLS